MPKITACLIVKNEAANIERCLRSFRDHVDHVIVVDTGSTDGTQEIARGIADRVVTTFEGIGPDGIEDFSAARNFALALVDPESWVFWCDGDDTVERAANLRGLLGQHPEGQPGMYLFPYEYAYDEHGNVTTLHWRERLLGPAKMFQWRMPVHEVLMPRDEFAGQIVGARTDAVLIKHNRAGKQYESGRNLRILDKWIAGDGKEDLRGWFYYGLELRKAGRIVEAREWLTKYARKSGWADEKCIALLELASLELSEGNLEEAIDWGQRAQVTKSWPDPYYVVGYALHAMAVTATDSEQKMYNYRRAAHYLRRGSEMGLSREGVDTVLFSNPSELYSAQRVLCACLATVGDFQGAVESCTLGLRGFPNDEGLLEYRREFQMRADLGKLEGLLGTMAERGTLSQEQLTIIRHALDKKFEVRVKRDELPEPAPKDGKLRIVFFTGPAYEDWTPETVREQGMGGSETMCVELAERLAKRGHAVRVYGQPDKEGTYESVQYLHYDRWGDVRGDVLVASRIPSAVDSGDFALRLLWVHDVHCGEELTRERILKFDRVLALSEWHKSFLCETYPMLDPECVVVTRNGIDLSQFRPEGAAPVVLGETGLRGVTSGGTAQIQTLEPAERYKNLRDEANGQPEILRWWAKEGEILVGGSLTSKEDWEHLKGAFGVQLVLNVESDHSDHGIVPTEALCETRIDDDGAPISGRKLAKALMFARAGLEASKPLYIHCMHGGSRSPAFAYLVLREIYRWTREQALGEINKGYPHHPDYPYGYHERHRGYLDSIDDFLSKTAPVDRNPHRLIYSSSPDRGLRTLLQMWPAIRERVPDAELHVFYGMENWEKSCDRYPDHPELCRAALDEVKRGLKQEGVHWHGRVKPAQLVQEFLKSGVWAYPTWFHETSCITAMQAQAAGCIPVTKSIAALRETVRAGWLLDKAYVNYLEPIEDAIVDALNERQAPTREEIRQEAQAFCIEALAAEWDQMLTELLQSVSEQPVPRYRGWRAA